MYDNFHLNESKNRLISFVLMFLCIAGPLIATIHFINEGPSKQFYTQFCAIVVLFTLYFDYKKRGNIERTTNILAFMGLGFFSFRYYSYGEYMAPTVMWFLIIAPSLAWLSKPIFAIVGLGITFVCLIFNVLFIFQMKKVMPNSMETIFIFGGFTISGYLTYLVLETKLLYERISNSIVKVEREKMHNNQLVTLGEFAGNVAHEINNPLQVIKGNANRLKRKANEKGDLNIEQIKKYADNIDRTVDRTNNLINSLLKLARFPNQEFPLKTIQFLDAWYDISPLLEEKVKSLGINLQIEGKETTIYTNPDLLGQVILNLINNSVYEIKYQENPWIIIKVFKENIDIVDSGHGIPHEIKKKILNPFFSTKQGEGTGLGLNLCHNLMAQMAGKLILLENTQNTTFRLKLPSA